MNIEENRLRTFSEWPVNAAVDSSRIARAGFYYAGRSLEVQCFLCGVIISEWNYGDQAMARHRQLSPTCPFVLNPSGTCNVPLMPPQIQLSPSSSSSSHSRNRQQNCNEESPAPSTALARHREPQPEYRTEAQRLRSFVNWPVGMIVSPESLAKAGFHYLQEADMVECAFCRGVIMKWEPGDDPDREHRIHFPNCDFYMHRDANAASTEKVELGNVKLTLGTESDLSELGIQTHTAPRQPKHATYEGRLRTYQGWPEGLRQTPEMLADAGFYYVGVEDQVRCFYCDGGLRNWEATDDAWTEHAKWFPRCGFLSLVRGQEFIKHCIDNRPPLDPAIFVGMSENGSGDTTGTSPPPSRLTVAPAPILRDVTDDEIEDLLNAAPAQAALDIGIHVDAVRWALRQRMEQTGLPYTNADQLIEDALRASEDASRFDNRTPESPSAELTDLLNRVIATRGSNDSADQNNEQINGEHRDAEEENVSQSVDRSGETVTNPKCCGVEPLEDANKKIIKTKKNKSTSNDSSVSLEEENRRLKEARLCKICMDREVAVVFLPCGHLSTCVHCAPSLKHCPMCRQEIRATVRTFLA